MTYSELYNNVAGLAFETSLEDNAVFYRTVKRALLQVAAVRPAVRTYTINHAPLENVATRESFMPILRRDELIIEGQGAKAFYFEADGKGIAYAEVYDGEDWQMCHDLELNGNRTFKAYRGFFKLDDKFVNAPARLRFVGDFVYSIRNVGLYKDVYSDDDEDIPAYEPFTRYDISALTDDFLALTSPPVLEDEHHAPLNGGYDVEDGRVILLPYGKGGCYKVLYKHKPTLAEYEYDVDKDNRVIDVDEDLAALLPNLVAAYLLAEDEPGLAEYYLTLYQQQAAVIASTVRDYTPIKIRHNGW